MDWMLVKLYSFFYSLEKEILDRYLEVVLKGNKDGLKVNSKYLVLCFGKINK